MVPYYAAGYSPTSATYLSGAEEFVTGICRRQPVSRPVEGDRITGLIRPVLTALACRDEVARRIHGPRRTPG
jgi:hypothetical protein